MNTLEQKKQEFKQQFLKADKELRKLMKIGCDISSNEQDNHCVEVIKAWRQLGFYLGLKEH